MYPDTTGPERKKERETKIQPGWKGRRVVGGGWSVCVWGGGKKNHYTARGWKGCHKEFHYFSSSIEKVDCAYCNFFPSHHKPLNNLGSFQGRSFPFPLRSLPRVQGRGAQSPQLKETLTHKNTPCHHHLLLLFHPPVLLSVLCLRSILNHSISHTSSSTSPCNHCPYSLLHSVCITLFFYFIPRCVFSSTFTFWGHPYASLDSAFNFFFHLL